MLLCEDVEPQALQPCGGREQAGYGRCKSCDCSGYRPNDPKNNFCRDCGHHFDQHR